MRPPPTDPPAIDDLIRDATGKVVGAPLEAQALADLALAALDAQGADASAAPRIRALCARGMAQHHAGHHVLGLVDLHQALAALPENDPALRAEVLRSMAVGYSQIGDLDEGLDWSRRALEAARRVGEPRLIAESQLVLGTACSRCGDSATALEHYRQVFAFHHATGNRTRCAGALNNIGITLKNMGRLADSVLEFERGLALVDQPEDAVVRATLRSNLAESLLLLGRPAEARDALVEAIDAFRHAGRPDPESDSRIRLGRVLLALDAPEAAQAELEHGLRLLESTGTLHGAASVHQPLAELHKAAGRFDLALRHQEAFHAAERAQFNSDSDRARNALRVRLEVAEARHQAEVHQLEHVQIAKAHAELQAMHKALLAADAEKNALVARLADQGRTDALTGLANRRQLDDWLAMELARARRHGQQLTVAMCDLDHFKRVNDAFGHATGDAVLRAVAGLLRERCRASDLVARYGGEEFCIGFPQTDGAAAALVCEALRDAIAAHDWSAVAPGLAVTLSIGLADELDVVNHERLLANADAQLYAAKHGGRNRVCWRGSTFSAGTRPSPS